MFHQSGSLTSTNLVTGRSAAKLRSRPIDGTHLIEQTLVLGLSNAVIVLSEAVIVLSKAVLVLSEAVFVLDPAWMRATLLR